MLWLLCSPWPAQALELALFQVNGEGQDYTVHAQGVVNSPARLIVERITDYAHLSDINQIVRSSTILEGAAHENALVRVEARACFLIYCTTKIAIQRYTLEPGRVRVEILPNKGHFKGENLVWEFKELEGNRTEFKLHSHIQPDFWIPPMVGSWVVRGLLSQEARGTLTTLDRLGGSTAPVPRPDPLNWDHAPPR
ncbi:MAG: hypothetical protein H7831_15375 [Magnetococcus sp. WYHC-3]